MFDSFFEPVPRWTMDRARQHIATHKLEEFHLLDVRQPDEYAEGHIPGARLIPLGELPGRVGEIERGKTTLVYCRSGGRAGNAVALLTQAGFGHVHNIGGIMEYNGLVASGAPEAGMAVFDAARKPEEYVALAWLMEEGARLFYLELSPRFAELKEMFETMAAGEERHRDQLAALHRELSGRAGAPDLEGAKELMEGGIERQAALTWANKSEAIDVLEFAATMEANAHDRYIHVGRALGGEVERAFLALAEAEKVHLGQLMQAFEQGLAGA